MAKYKDSTVAIMQPYFFPYLGYFSLIKASDYWIVFDPVQYIRKGWINRNRILAPEKPKGGWQYIRVPIIKAPRDTKIEDIRVNDDKPWRSRIIRQLEHYKKKAPYYAETIGVVADALESDFSSIAHLNTCILKIVCDYIGIQFNYEIYSEMGFPDMPISQPSDWAFNICKYLEVDTYINPPGGKNIFDRRRWKEHGISLRYLTSNLPYYSQRRDESIMGLSIIDVMMFNSPDDIRTMLDDFRYE
jgi:hypothetical protein